MGFWVCLLGSFFIVAFGHPAWIPSLGIVAAAVGFAIFWQAMIKFQRPAARFFLSMAWFGSVQAVQLSWLASTDYMGPLILLVYFFLCAAIGAQFGLLSLLIGVWTSGKKMTWLNCFALAGCWVLLEWVRLFFMTGFTWNPVGLALADFSYSLQLASVFGIYGLSFWVLFTNLSAFKFFTGKERLRTYLKKPKSLAVWSMIALFPYFWGAGQQKWIESIRTLPAKTYSVALVQTALLPEEKDFYYQHSAAFVPPLDQWERVFAFLDLEREVDLIVLPEAAFPFGAYRFHYPFEWVKDSWERYFGKGSSRDFPPLELPFASKYHSEWKVNNAFFSQALSNHFNADVIIGLDDQDIEMGKKYNAAFHFHPQGIAPDRCEKRVLVPVGEYIPLQQWGTVSRFVSDQFGIGDSFEPGAEAKIFHASVPIGVSICLEETYGGLIRDLRLKGAQLFVNVTNDVWFPRSQLPQHQFQHARVRSVENGVYTVRSCNTGVTGGIDCFGRPLEILPISENAAGVLYLTFPIRSYQTFYMWWGDSAILGIGLVSLALQLIFFRKKKLP